MQELIITLLIMQITIKVGLCILIWIILKRATYAYGHLFGDQLLRDVSLAIFSCLNMTRRPRVQVVMSFWYWHPIPLQSALEAMASTNFLPAYASPFVLV
ncbi:hypothetical protein ACNKHV_08000 [Shigella flexneri]